VARGEALERLEVRRGHRQRAPLGQLFQHGLRERRPVVGIGAGAQLVQHDERPLVDVFEHEAQLPHERREGREVLGHALLVAHDGEDLGEDGQARALAGRDV
jgi:hypothetical protein